MELVTGRGGEDHISSADIASMLRGVYSDADVVLPLDDDLALTILSANSAQIGKGGCMLQGHFARVETAEQLVIESGAPGFNRNDLIVARYTLGDNNIQAVYLAVIKGTAVAGTASDPAYVDGSIDDGDTLVEFPLWRVPIAGVNVGTPERIMPTVDTLQSQITEVRESVSPRCKLLWSGVAGIGVTVSAPGLSSYTVIGVMFAGSRKIAVINVGSTIFPSVAEVPSSVEWVISTYYAELTISGDSVSVIDTKTAVYKSGSGGQPLVLRAGDYSSIAAIYGIA